MNLRKTIAGLTLAFALAFAGTVNASSISTGELINLLIELGIISADQAQDIQTIVDGP